MKSDTSADSASKLWEKRVTRRQALSTAGKVAIGLAGAAVVGGGVTYGLTHISTPTETTSLTSTTNSLAGETLRVQLWRASLGDSMVTGIVNPFMKATGANVVVELGYTSETVAKVLAQKSDPQLDIVMMDEIGFWQLLSQGVLDIFPTDVEGLQNVPPNLQGFAQGRGVGILIDPWLTPYNTNVYKTPPDSMSILWDSSTSKHQYHVPYITSAAWLDIVRIATLFGGNQFDVEPAFEQMQKLVDAQLLASDNYGQLAQLFQTGDLSIGIGDAVAEGYPPFVQKGTPVSWSFKTKPGWVALLGGMGVVTGHAAKDAVIKAFIEYALRPESQDTLVQSWFPPANTKTQIPDNVKPYLPTPEDYNNVIPTDIPYLASVKPVWQERLKKMGFG